MAGGRFGLDPKSPVYYRALVNKYRDPLRVGPPRKSVAEIPEGATSAELHRVGKSHAGIAARTELTELAAVAADQNFMDEIGELSNLERLDLRFPMRAPDLSPLTKLKKLRTLRLDGCSKVVDFSPIAMLPALSNLQIENAQHLYDIEWIRPLKDRLFVLGIEGSVSKDQRIASFAPLGGFAFEAIFTVSIMLKDRDLTPLETCPNLHLYEGTRCAPREHFERLEKTHPEMICAWFDWDRWRPASRTT